MTISLQEFANGDTNYIAKHNANIAALTAFLNSLESSLSSISGSGSGLANSTNIGMATYGQGGMTFVGSESFTYTLGAATMTLAGGFCWDPTLGLMHYKEGETVLSFTLLGTGTYYIRFDGTSTPYIDTTSTGAIYSVVWDGASFGTITQLATLTPTAPDIGALADSIYSGISYLSPEARLQATEKAFSALLSADVSASDFTPTVAQAMEAIGVRLIGALTVNRTLTVPAKAKVHVVRNECTTSNDSTITVKTAAGSGVALLAGEHAVLYCDGTDVFHIFRQGADVPVNSLLRLNDTPATFTGQGLKLLRVREDESGTEFVAPGSVVAPAALVVEEEAVTVDGAVGTFNFTGSGVAVVQDAAGQVSIVIPGASAAGLVVEEDGVIADSTVVQINFTGDGVSVTQDAAGQITVNIPGLSGGAVDYDVAFYIADKRAAGSVAFRHTFTRAVNFAANFALSEADAVNAATAEAIFPIKKNGTQVGSLTFAATGSTGTFTSSGGLAVSFAAGDILEITAPDPQDATLSGVSISLAGVRA